MTKILIRRGTSSEWSSENPVLSSGEQGFETNTGKLKIGNGSDNWSSLPYIGSGDSLSWTTLVTTWTTTPTQVGTTGSGVVFSYVLGSTTRYRFVPNTYDSSQDAFYSGWDGASLTGLIITRG